MKISLFIILISFSFGVLADQKDNVIQDRCKDYTGVGFEEKLIKCDMENYASAKPEYLKSCRAISRSHSDRIELCLTNIMSKDKELSKLVENCMKYQSEKERGACISNVSFDNVLRSKLSEDHVEAIPKILDMQFSDGFNTPLLSAGEPDQEFLRSCINTMSNKARISSIGNDTIVFRTTVNPSQPTNRMLGTYLKQGSSVHFFSDNSLKDYFENNCKEAAVCTFNALISNKTIQVSMSKNTDEKGRLTTLPMNIVFGNSVPITSVGTASAIESKTVFTPEKIDPKENKFINAQVARAVISSIGLESENYHQLEKLKMKLTNEAYAQIKKGIDDCTNLLDLMITDNRNDLYREIDLLTKQLASMYQKQRIPASDDSFGIITPSTTEK